MNGLSVQTLADASFCQSDAIQKDAGRVEIINLAGCRAFTPGHCIFLLLVVGMHLQEDGCWFKYRALGLTEIRKQAQGGAHLRPFLV